MLLVVTLASCGLTPHILTFSGCLVAGADLKILINIIMASSKMHELYLLE